MNESNMKDEMNEKSKKCMNSRIKKERKKGMRNIKK